MEIGDLFPKRLRTLRRAKGLTQQELGAGLGVHAQTIKDYEAGRRRPTFNGLSKIATFFGVPESDLVGQEAVYSPPIKGIMAHSIANKIASIPDDVYFLAEQIGSNSPIWLAVIELLKEEAGQAPKKAPLRHKTQA